VPWADRHLAYRVRQLTLASDHETISERPGVDLLAEGLAWPLTADRTAVLWVLDAHG
jgi:hypothetical protein